MKYIKLLIVTIFCFLSFASMASEGESKWDWSGITMKKSLDSKSEDFKNKELVLKNKSPEIQTTVNTPEVQAIKSSPSVSNSRDDITDVASTMTDTLFTMITVMLLLIVPVFLFKIVRSNF